MADLLYKCKVGVPEFTPPELQGKDLSSVVRTTNHDDFGLAILIFCTLMMGRHPFAGRYLGQGDMPMDRAIAEYRFAYSSRRGSTLMEAPPNVPTLADLPLSLADAFERAFGPGGSRWTSRLGIRMGNTARQSRRRDCPVHVIGCSPLFPVRTGLPLVSDGESLSRFPGVCPNLPDSRGATAYQSGATNCRGSGRKGPRSGTGSRYANASYQQSAGEREFDGHKKNPLPALARRNCRRYFCGLLSHARSSRTAMGPAGNDYQCSRRGFETPGCACLGRQG